MAHNNTKNMNLLRMHTVTLYWINWCNSSVKKSYLYAVVSPYTVVFGENVNSRLCSNHSLFLLLCRFEPTCGWGSCVWKHTLISRNLCFENIWFIKIIFQWGSTPSHWSANTNHLDVFWAYTCTMTSTVMIRVVEHLRVTGAITLTVSWKNHGNTC